MKKFSKNSKLTLLVIMVATACGADMANEPSQRSQNLRHLESPETLSAQIWRESKLTEEIHEDEVIASCIARNKKKRQVYALFTNLAAVAKLDALTDCVVESQSTGDNPCDCEIATCSPIEPSANPMDLIAQILRDRAIQASCSEG